MMLNHTKGPPQLKKSLKVQLLTKFFGPPPPLFEKGPYQQKRRYFVPNSNYKVWFFQNFKPLPPLFHQKAKPHRFLSIEVAPKQVFTGAGFKSPAPLSMSITIGLSGLTKLLSETRLASKP